MNICYLIHGIEVRNPQESTIAFLATLLPNNGVIPLLVKILSYGWFPVIAFPFVRAINWFAVRSLQKQIKPGCILIGHSNGCTVSYGLSKKVATKGLVLVNPALDADVEFPPDLEFIHVYWSDKDRVTALSKLVPFSLWGDMGNRGYFGLDPRVKQWNMGVRHTSLGNSEVAAVWGPKIVNNLIDELI